MLFELRSYRLHPGTRDRWVRYMEEVIIPFLVARGFVVVGSFTLPEDPDGYIWLCRFESDEERNRLYAATYESDEWKERIRPGFADMLIREMMVVTTLEPTPKSVIH